MSEDAFSSMPRRSPVALVDLVETKVPETNAAFVSRATQLAGECGGHSVLANEAIVPMIVPDERASMHDHATGLFVVTVYPTPEAARMALAERERRGAEFSIDPIRTYAARPSRGVEALIQGTLPRALGLITRAPEPDIEDPQQIEALIEAAHVLNDNPDAGVYEASWTELMERAGQRPIWMVNYLEFAQTAEYADRTAGAAPSKRLSGAQAYDLYGRGMVGTLGAVGGRVGWSSRVLGQVAGTDDGKWHQIAIAVYPSPVAMMTMLSMTEYRAAHVHREAGLARTRLLATQPIEGL